MIRALLAALLLLGSLSAATPQAGYPVVSPSATVGGVTCTLGSSCQPKVQSFGVGSSTRNLTTASGTQGVTGLGFQPSYCNFSGSIGSGTLGTYTSLWGFVDSALHQAATSYVGTSAIQITSGFVMVAADATNAANQLAAVSSFDADGFTLTWTKNGSPTGTFTFAYSCLK